MTFETRATSDDGFTLEGYAAVFDSPTRIDSWEGTFDEVIQRGAFAKTIEARKPVVQFDHGHDIATGSVPISVHRSHARGQARPVRRGTHVRQPAGRARSARRSQGEPSTG